MQDWIFAVLAAVAVALIIIGVAYWSTAAAFIVAGVGVAGWAWLVLVYGEAGKE